jgi:microsomal prostaglandin-E synthase 1
MAKDPTLTTYCIATLALVVNLVALWAYSGFVRAKTKVVINEEDARTVATGAAVELADPPTVARVLRAHANAMAIIVPFLLLGWLYVVLGGGTTMARVLFGAFVVARFAHSFAYITATQPWRTITFVASMAATTIVFGNVVWLLSK